MSSARQIASRNENRESQFKGDFSCFLVSMDNPELEIAIRPLDVSPRGLGFLVRQEIPGGQFFYLRIGEVETKLRVELAYCSSYLGIENLFRCGLFLREEQGDLKLLCIKAGILDIIS
jgi:hypothetical protein